MAPLPNLIQNTNSGPSECSRTDGEEFQVKLFQNKLSCIVFFVATLATCHGSIADEPDGISAADLQIVNFLEDSPEDSASDAPVHLTAVKRSVRDPLASTVEQAINTARRRYLDANEHTPWQIMHGLLGLRYGYYLKQDRKLVHGLTWISAGREFEGSSWFEKVGNVGRAHSFTRPYAFQGHANQFLAIISMAGIPLNHVFLTADKEPVTVQDMVDNAKLEISEEDELAWTLWALSRYLPPNAEWINKKGEPWSIERIVETQVRKPINNRTYCGGTHCMFALAHARNIYLRSGQPLRGIWLEADQKIKKHIQIARKLQNRDGMFSTDYFNSRERKEDFSERIASAGHILEFVMLSASQREMRQTWVRKGVLALSKDLVQNANAAAKCGPLYHTVDGLIIFLDRTQPGAVRRLMAHNASTRSVRTGVAKPAVKKTTPKAAPDKEDAASKKEDASVSSQTKSAALKVSVKKDLGVSEFKAPIKSKKNQWKSRSAADEPTNQILLDSGARKTKVTTVSKTKPVPVDDSQEEDVLLPLDLMELEDDE